MLCLAFGVCGCVVCCLNVFIVCCMLEVGLVGFDWFGV